jgi:hypothetical protein
VGTAHSYPWLYYFSVVGNELPGVVLKPGCKPHTPTTDNQKPKTKN